ncbi:MAG: hypothetical protein CMC79_03220 [Flavobacteriaceae bacterium]|nr:hypothetical protein [Flavobacteriaceae bacterium]|tara:strand:- start:1659 stop:2690 length:1032 start_codon:yes stop_codon:yes gene_type:complete
MQLYNKLSAIQRKKIIESAREERFTLSFYKYANIGNPKLFRNHIFLKWNSLDILGRIYVASEGINAQLSVPGKNFLIFKKHLDSISFLNGVRINIAIEHNNKSFLKLTIKVKDKIVADGLVDDSFDVTKKGVHVNALEFNNLLEDPKTICVDIRNHYESEIGHFQGAITPDVDTFRQSLPFIEKNIIKGKQERSLLLYCTGGIRCEKASAYFKHKGFKNVFQLQGGIIDYARQTKALGIKNKFIGKNFVFDERRSEKISDDIISKCHQCGDPCDIHINCSNPACHLLFIQCEKCNQIHEKCCSDNCRKIKRLPYEEQKKLRKGKHNSNKIFKKGRSEVLKFKK